MFLRWDKVGSTGYWVVGSGKMRWRVWLRWGRLLRWWWLRPRRAVPRSQRGRHWQRLRRIVSRTAVCQA